MNGITDYIGNIRKTVGGMPKGQCAYNYALKNRSRLSVECVLMSSVNHIVAYKISKEIYKT